MLDITAARLEMDSNLDIKALNDLIKLAESSTEEALEKEKESSFSPIITRAKSMVKNAIPDNLNKVKFTAMLQGKKQQISTEETDFNKKISLSINWMVTLIKDLLKKVNGQSELITALMNKFVSKDELNAELEKKVEKLEDDLLTALNEKQVVLEQVQLDCDEARQRGLKGNLIVSSPKRTLADGSVVQYSGSEGQ